MLPWKHTTIQFSDVLITGMNHIDWKHLKQKWTQIYTTCRSLWYDGMPVTTMTTDLPHEGEMQGSPPTRSPIRPRNQMTSKTIHVEKKPREKPRKTTRIENVLLRRTQQLTIISVVWTKSNMFLNIWVKANQLFQILQSVRKLSHLQVRVCPRLHINNFTLTYKDERANTHKFVLKGKECSSTSLLWTDAPN